MLICTCTFISKMSISCIHSSGSKPSTMSDIRTTERVFTSIFALIMCQQKPLWTDISSLLRRAFMHIINKKGFLVPYICLWNWSWLPYLCSYVYLFVTTAGLKIVIHWSSCWPKVQCWTIKQELNNSPFLSVNLFISTKNWPHLWMEDMIYANTRRYNKTNPLVLNHQLKHDVWFSTFFIKICCRLIPTCPSTASRLSLTQKM